ncbi:MAG: hypothetical protein DLM53_07760 [Candidatus Eremiobacter antarcticus]|nr:hypothetical protein [Candidatus Eremiobacteraeota bacterium]PZR61861.1 MAG: hypothetical protein DLM53_07760 [Candidatus Eremiobacter sp. RRmetagenome_bin22]
MRAGKKSDPIYPWIIGAILVLISMAVIVSAVFQKPNAAPPNTGTMKAPSSALPSLNPAQRAAQTIMSATERTKGKTASRLLDEAFAHANATFGKQIFQRYAMGRGQTLDVYVNDATWRGLSDVDQNTLFAAAASSWATIWQQTTGKRLHNGLLMRVLNHAGVELRRDTFQEQS